MSERTAGWILRAAGLYGVAVSLPGLLREARYSAMFPPTVNHPEFYYGFYAVTLAWQLAFLVMATEPVRYRLLLLPAMVEKGLFPVLIVWLYATGRVSAMMFGMSLVDALFLALFIAAFRGLREPRP